MMCIEFFIYVFLNFLFVRIVYLRALCVQGVAQDLFVACELYFVTAMNPVVGGCLVACVQGVTLFDGYLFFCLEERIGWGYLSSPSQWSFFFSSAKQIGRKHWPFWIGSIAFLQGALIPLLFFPKVTWEAIGCALTSLSVGLFMKSGWKQENGWWRLQRSALKLTRSHPLVFKGREIYFPTEVNTPISPHYPLLRAIHSFQGKRLCEVEVTPGERPHIFWIFLESFGAGELERHPEVAPEFDRLKKQGHFFSKFYSNGVLTSHALLSSLFGIPPFYLSKQEREEGNIVGSLGSLCQQKLIGIADLLKQVGYQSVYLDNTAIDYEQHGAFLRAHGFDFVIGREEIENVISQEEMGWGGHDEFLFSYFLQWLEKKDPKGNPLFCTLFTLSNHHPWTLPPSRIPTPFPHAKTPQHQAFLQTMHYTDHCLGQFIKKLQQTEFGEKSLIFVLGDHGQAFEKKKDLPVLRDLHEDNVHVPLLLLSPGRIFSPQTLDLIGSHIDLMPTLMDLVHLQGVYHGMGHSLLREISSRSATYFSTLQGFHLGSCSEKGRWTSTDGKESCSFGEWFSLKSQAEETFTWVHSLFKKRLFTWDQNEVIDFSNDPNFSQEKFFLALKSSPVPKIVRLKNCIRIDPKGWKKLIHISPSLIELDLSGTLVTDEILAQIIKKGKKLKTLSLTDCHLLT